MEGRHLLNGSLLAAGALFLGAGCQGWRVQRDAILPTQLALLVQDRSGHPLSIVMDLRRNTRDQLDVRVSEGQRLFDGQHLWDIGLHREDAGYRVRLSDLISDQTRDLPLLSSTPPELVSFDRMNVWLRTSAGLVHCALTREMCEASAEAGHSALDHMGPGRGFKLVLEPDGDMRLTLPLDPDDAGQIILQNVDRVIGAHWIHEGFMKRDPTLDRVFRGRASLGAILHEVAVDGQLGEWSTAQPLVVDSPWQIESGADNWDGPGDASFSVTAAYSTGLVCFAGRVRDDHVGAGDEMTLQVGELRLSVPLDGRAVTPGVGVVSNDWYGRRFEACMPVTLPASGTLPFFAALCDADGEAGQTVLASSPEGEPDIFGTIRASP